MPNETLIKGEKFYTSKNDTVFKTIICNEYDKRFLRKILEVILEKRIYDITFMRSERPKFNVSERAKVIDLLVCIDSQELIHVELNSSSSKAIRFRNFCYFGNVISIDTKSNNKYNAEQKYIHVDLTYGLSQKQDNMVYYYIQDKKQKKYIYNIKIIEVNMDRIKNSCYNDGKYRYLAMLDMNLTELSEQYKGDELIMDYKERLEKLNQNPNLYQYLTDEEAYRLQYNTDMSEAIQKGEARGKRIGKKEGVKEANLKLVKVMYEDDASLEKISKYTNFSVEEIKKILNIV